MEKSYEYQGKTFQLTQSEKSFVVVRYQGLVGHVGAALNPTKEHPFLYARDEDGNDSIQSPDGIDGGNGMTGTFQEHLDALCRDLANHWEQVKSKPEYWRWELYQEINDFMDGLK